MRIGRRCCWCWGGRPPPFSPDAIFQLLEGIFLAGAFPKERTIVTARVSHKAREVPAQKKRPKSAPEVGFRKSLKIGQKLK